MKFDSIFRFLMVAVLIVGFGGWAAADEQETPAQAGEDVAVAATFVRVASNDEGWVVLGYGTANESVGEKLMLLHIGLTLTDAKKGQTLYRDDISLVTPKGEEIPLPSQEDFAKVSGEMRPLLQRDAMVGESINYFPVSANQPCLISFFAYPGVTLVRDTVELSIRRACTGRIYFELPDGIQLGTYNLDVQFEGGVIRVPFQIMTKEQAKAFQKEWKAKEKQEKQEKKDKK